MNRAQWRCARCGVEHTSWAAAERHADATKHARIELTLTRRSA